MTYAASGLHEAGIGRRSCHRAAECFIVNQAGIDFRHRIGVDRLTYESDYPHSDSQWPHSRKAMVEMLAAVPDDEAHRIAELNACELLGWRPWAD